MKMTVSYEWLCDLVTGLDAKSPEEVGLALTALGAETENITPLSYGANIQLGKITHITKLEKLSKIIVETSQKSYITVSNSNQLEEGQHILVAPVGTRIFGDKTVESKTIEGIQTEALLLALENLGIETKSSDIAYLGKDPMIAQEFFTAYTQLDAIYTLDVPGNRADWLSVRGLARALAISFNLDLKDSLNFQGTESAPDIQICIESNRCNRYSLRKISNIQNGVSSGLYQKRLHLLGMRPINKIVDLTNIIMLETGQPTHAFDTRTIKNKIIIRQAKNGETLTLLDEQQITLTENDLLICDDSKILALAGIMGGLDSGVQDDTTSIYLESASFNGTWVRRSSKRLGLKTESSLRFEKNITSELVPMASDSIAYLLGGITSKTNDIYPNPTQTYKIECSPDDIRLYLGIPELDDSTMALIIQKIGCELLQHEHNWTIIPSGERADLKIKEDIMEEIARFYGYDNIPASTYRPSSVQLNPEKSFEEKIRPLLRGMGLSEAVTVVFRSPETRVYNKISNITPVEILNPLNTEWTEMRTHLFDGLLGVLKHNASKAFEKNIALSEIASTFHKKESDYIEEKRLAFLLSNDISSYEKALNILNNILTYAKLKNVTAKRISNGIQYGFLHPLNAFELVHEGIVIGFFGEIHPELTEQYDLSDKKDFPNPVVCEIDFNILKINSEVKTPMENLQELPPILRDITISVPSDSLGINIQEDIKALHPALNEVTFISVFQNEKLQELSMKNLSLRLRFDHVKDIAEIDNFIKSLLTKQY